MDAKGSLIPATLGKHCIYLVVDYFDNYIVTAWNPKNNAHYSVNSYFYHCISKFGPALYVITDRRTEYPITEIATCCALLIIRPSSHGSRTIGLVEVQNRNPGAHLRIILKDTPEKRAFQVYFSTCAHKFNPCHFCLFHYMKKPFAPNRSFN